MVRMLRTLLNTTKNECDSFPALLLKLCAAFFCCPCRVRVSTHADCRERLFLGNIEDPGGRPHRDPGNQWCAAAALPPLPCCPAALPLPTAAADDGDSLPARPTPPAHPLPPDPGTPQHPTLTAGM